VEQDRLNRLLKPKAPDRERLQTLARLIVDKLAQKGLEQADDDAIKKIAVEELMTHGLPPDKAAPVGESILALLRAQTSANKSPGFPDANSASPSTS
jgi:hypothetical protein